MEGKPKIGVPIMKYISLFLVSIFATNVHANSCINDFKGTQEKIKKLLSVADCSASSLYQCGYDQMGSVFVAGMAARAGKKSGSMITQLGIRCRIVNLDIKFLNWILPSAFASGCANPNLMKQEISSLLRSLEKGIDSSIDDAGHAWLKSAQRTTEERLMINKIMEISNGSPNPNHIETQRLIQNTLWGGKDPVSGKNFKGMFTDYVSADGAKEPPEGWEKKLNFKNIRYSITNKGPTRRNLVGEVESNIKNKWNFLSHPTFDGNRVVTDGFRAKNMVAENYQRIADANMHRMKETLEFLQENSDHLAEDSRAKLGQTVKLFNDNFGETCNLSSNLWKSIFNQAHAAKSCKVKGQMKPTKMGHRFMRYGRGSKVLAKGALRFAMGATPLGAAAGVFVAAAGATSTAKCDMYAPWLPYDKDCNRILVSSYAPFYEHINDIGFNDENLKNELGRDPSLCGAIDGMYEKNFGNVKGLKCSKTEGTSLVKSEPIRYVEGKNSIEITHEGGKVSRVRIYNGGRPDYEFNYDALGEVSSSGLYKQGARTGRNGARLASNIPDERFSYKKSPVAQNSDSASGILNQANFMKAKIIKAFHLCSTGKVEASSRGSRDSGSFGGKRRRGGSR